MSDAKWLYAHAEGDWSVKVTNGLARALRQARERIAEIEHQLVDKTNRFAELEEQSANLCGKIENIAGEQTELHGRLLRARARAEAAEAERDRLRAAGEALVQTAKPRNYRLYLDPPRCLTYSVLAEIMDTFKAALRREDN